MPHPDEGPESEAEMECPDGREALRQACLAEARRVVLGTPCHDIPTESGEMRDGGRSA